MFFDQIPNNTDLDTARKEFTTKFFDKIGKIPTGKRVCLHTICFNPPPEAIGPEVQGLHIKFSLENGPTNQNDVDFPNEFTSSKNETFMVSYYEAAHPSVGW